MSESVSQTGPVPKYRYDADGIRGRGLMKLSYFVESRYVTRGFKNHLKSLDLFRPAYRKQDKQKIWYEPDPVRRYSDTISNRKFKKLWIRIHSGLRGLKDQPRKLIKHQPVLIGTVTHSLGRFDRSALLTKAQARSLDLHILRAKRVAKAIRKAIPAPKADAGSPELPTVSAVLPSVGRASRRVGYVMASTSGEYPTLFGGQSFPSFDELRRRALSGDIKIFKTRGSPEVSFSEGT